PHCRALCGAEHLWFCHAMSADTSIIAASLSADVPIHNREQDLLGYWPFAQSIARGITERSPDDGFVLGVQARWGMGKTSAVNLIVRAIESAEEHLEPSKK